MKEFCSNIYQTARKAAGFTQEEASAHLNLSIRSLADYEAGRTIPGDDIVCSMVEVYKAKYLAYLHLKMSSEVGRKYLPDISISDLPISVLRLQKEVSDINQINSEMIDIACDGVIDERENSRWKNVTKEVCDMAGAALALMFAR